MIENSLNTEIEEGELLPDQIPLNPKKNPTTHKNSHSSLSNDSSESEPNIEYFTRKPNKYRLPRKSPRSTNQNPLKRKASQPIEIESKESHQKVIKKENVVQTKFFPKNDQKNFPIHGISPPIGTPFFGENIGNVNINNLSGQNMNFHGNKNMERFGGNLNKQTLGPEQIGLRIPPGYNYNLKRKPINRGNMNFGFKNQGGYPPTMGNPNFPINDFRGKNIGNNGPRINNNFQMGNNNNNNNFSTQMRLGFYGQNRNNNDFSFNNIMRKPIDNTKEEVLENNIEKKLNINPEIIKDNELIEKKNNVDEKKQSLEEKEEIIAKLCKISPAQKEKLFLQMKNIMQSKNGEIEENKTGALQKLFSILPQKNEKNEQKNDQKSKAERLNEKMHNLGIFSIENKEEIKEKTEKIKDPIIENNEIIDKIDKQTKDPRKRKP